MSDYMPDIQMESRSHGWRCAEHLVASTGGMLCKDQSTDSYMAAARTAQGWVRHNLSHQICSHGK